MTDAQEVHLHELVMNCRSILAHDAHPAWKELHAYVESLIAAEREACKTPPCNEEVTIYYMRDNHTFRALPLDVDGAIATMREERDAGHTYGMLCSKHPELRNAMHAYGSERWEAFEHFARTWLERAIAIRAQP